MFRASARRAAEHQAAQRAAGDQTGLHGAPTEAIRAHVEDALAAEADPESAETSSVVDGIVARYTAEFGTTDTPAYRAALGGLTKIQKITQRKTHPRRITGRPRNTST
jgi:hypothetical protein